MMNKHAVSIKWSDEDNGYIAAIPGIKALSAFGPTREKALSELNTAAEAYFEALQETGRSLPPQEKIISYSGQLRLRMPRSLHSALAGEAEGEGVSLNTHIVALLSERHMEKKLLNKIESIENLIGSTGPGWMPDHFRPSQPRHRAEESKTKYKKA
jgi:predicted RNase H-like HicB family nuclease